MMTSTNNSKFCKSCGDYRQIEDNKCTVCDAEYSDGVVARIRNTLERQKVLQGRQSSTGYFGVNRPVSVDESVSRRKQKIEHMHSDITDTGQETEDNTLYLNFELTECSHMAPNIPPRQVKCTSRKLLEKLQEEFVEALVDCDKSKKTFHKGDIITVTDRKSDGYRDIIEGRIGTMEVTLPETHVKPYDNNPERSLLVIATHLCLYDGIIKVEFGKRVKLKNKYLDYYWVEFEGKEGWIAVDCVVFAPRNEEIKDNVIEPSSPTNPGKKSGKDWTQSIGAGPPLPPKPVKQSKYLSFKKVSTSQREDKEEDIRIILLGKTGSGKSATANSIAGKQVFESTISGQSVTKKCEKSNSICNGRQFVLIDTPKPNLSHETIQSEIIRCVHLSLPGPHLFLIILQITR